MANPSGRRYSLSNPASENYSPTLLQSVAIFLKRPQAFPFLLSIFVVLTWLSLRLQHLSSSQIPKQQQQQWIKRDESDDMKHANFVRFSSGFPSPISRDKRGWLLNPVSAALDAGISGGAQSCASVHVGEIRPGGVRGNHRHHTCNETFIIWGADTKLRLENSHMAEKGYLEVTIGAKEVAVAASPSGTAHALVNIDHTRTTFFLGCQDSIITNNSLATDFNVWKDL